MRCRFGRRLCDATAAADSKFCVIHRDLLRRIGAEDVKAGDERLRKASIGKKRAKRCLWLDCADRARPDSKYCGYHLGMADRTGMDTRR